jgi:hypothetical protein
VVLAAPQEGESGSACGDGVDLTQGCLVSSKIDSIEMTLACVTDEVFKGCNAVHPQIGWSAWVLVDRIAGRVMPSPSFSCTTAS